MLLTRDDFLLDPTVIFLNHGSYGACPRVVFDVYQQWQRELETQPVEFLGRRAMTLLQEARAQVAPLFNIRADDFIFVMNATEGLNIVARWLMLNHLKAGDEILTTDHEYGATNNMWRFACHYTGAVYKPMTIPLPVTTEEAFTEAVWAGVTPRTKILFLSHITSATGLIFPIAELCRRARQAGIMTIIDGAHVPQHIPLDLPALDVDFYAGNFHKWVCSPKGSAFLYVHPQYQAALEPLIISHGWPNGWPLYDDALLPLRHQGQGTRDIAAFLTVPAALAFQQEHDWDTVRTECRRLRALACEKMRAWTELTPLSPNTDVWLGQLAACPLPPCDAAQVKERLYDEYRVEMPVYDFNGVPYARFALQVYNTVADIDAAVAGLRALIE